MALELPGPVVDFLQVIGINWPDINEDSVRAVAGHVRDFASDIENTHQAATQTVQAMNASYSGASYEQLVQTWAKMSSSHMSDLVDGCRVVATALDAAADAIVVAKGVAIGELVALAASFVADQAAAVLTFGIAEAAEALVIEAAKTCVNALEQQLEQMVIGEVLQAAMTPLEGIVERAVSGFKLYEEYGHILRARCFPLGLEFEERSALFMAENGEVYLEHGPTGTYYVGASMDAALDASIDMKAVFPGLWEYYDLDVVEESGWRFNDRTTPILFGAGWSLGRDLGADADEMIVRTVAGARELGYELEPFPAAVAAVHEFGGLTFTKAALEAETGFDGTDLRLEPGAALEWVPRTGEVLERTLGRRCFPLGRDLDYDFVVWMDSDGRVYEVSKSGRKIYLAGETVDKALTNWLGDFPFEEISVRTDEPED